MSINQNEYKSMYCVVGSDTYAFRTAPFILPLFRKTIGAKTSFLIIEMEKLEILNFEVIMGG